jgi:hypothetical protein
VKTVYGLNAWVLGNEGCSSVGSWNRLSAEVQPGGVYLWLEPTFCRGTAWRGVPLVGTDFLQRYSLEGCTSGWNRLSAEVLVHPPYGAPRCWLWSRLGCLLLVSSSSCFIYLRVQQILVMVSGAVVFFLFLLGDLEPKIIERDCAQVTIPSRSSVSRLCLKETTSAPK